MKHLIALLLILALLSTFALAEPDLAGMTDDELYQLRDAINLELSARIPAGEALGAWDTSCAHFELLEAHAGTTFSGDPGAALIFSYTNVSQDIDHFMAHVYVKVFANGIEAGTAAIIGEYMIGDGAVDVMPGASLQRIPMLYTFRDAADVIDVFIIDTSTYEYKELDHLTIALSD